MFCIFSAGNYFSLRWNRLFSWSGTITRTLYFFDRILNLPFGELQYKETSLYTHCPGVLSQPWVNFVLETCGKPAVGYRLIIFFSQNLLITTLRAASALERLLQALQSVNCIPTQQPIIRISCETTIYIGDARVTFELMGDILLCFDRTYFLFSPLSLFSRGEKPLISLPYNLMVACHVEVGFNPSAERAISGWTENHAAANHWLYPGYTLPMGHWPQKSCITLAFILLPWIVSVINGHLVLREWDYDFFPNFLFERFLLIFVIFQHWPQEKKRYPETNFLVKSGVKFKPT